MRYGTSWSRLLSPFSHPSGFVCWRMWNLIKRQHWAVYDASECICGGGVARHTHINRELSMHVFTIRHWYRISSRYFSMSKLIVLYWFVHERSPVELWCAVCSVWVWADCLSDGDSMHAHLTSIPGLTVFSGPRRTKQILVHVAKYGPICCQLKLYFIESVHSVALLK